MARELFDQILGVKINFSDWNFIGFRREVALSDGCIRRYGEDKKLILGVNS